MDVAQSGYSCNRLWQRWLRLFFTVVQSLPGQRPAQARCLECAGNAHPATVAFEVVSVGFLAVIRVFDAEHQIAFDALQARVALAIGKRDGRAVIWKLKQLARTGREDDAGGTSRHHQIIHGRDEDL